MSMRFRLWIMLSGSLLGLVMGLFVVVMPARAASPVNVLFNMTNPAPCSLAQDTGFLAFPTWYEYLQGTKVNVNGGGTECRPFISGPDGIWLIVAAVFEILLRLSAILAVGFVIWGAIRYTTSAGSPNSINDARNTIVNALVGLVITVTAARIIGFIAGEFAAKIDAASGLPNPGAVKAGTLAFILTLVFQIVAVLAAIMVVWGGLTYTRSGGDPGTLKQAKETIIYAVVGLIFALFAQVIVGFVLGTGL
ncbi:MAG TPA: hypothetical protein VGS28_01740 [Candidatus Saccharimonadales bacterium]|nr:hypothetical protein [Candidatus Saccharimonadales bacterium]